MLSRSSSAIALTSGRIAGSLFGLATAMVLARLLSQTDYGLYQQVWLVYNIALPFMMLGLPASITYFAPQMGASGQKMLTVQTALLMGVAGLLIASLTYVLAEPLAESLGGEQLSPLLRAFFWYPVFSLPILFVDALLVATYRAKSAAWLNLFTSGIHFASVVVPVALGMSLVHVIHVMCAAGVLRFGVIAFLIMRGFSGVAFSWDPSFVGRQFKYAVPLGLSEILGTLIRQLDRVMIAWYFPAAVYAIYENGARELPFVAIVAGSVMAVVIPDFVRLHKQGQGEEILRLWHSATVKVALLFFPLTAFLMVFARDFVVLLFSERYAESTQIFRIYLLLLPLRITMYGSLLMAAGRSSLILVANVVTLGLNLGLNLALIPTIGLAGAALAAVISVYAVAGWLLRASAKLLSVSWAQIFPWRPLARLIVVSVIPALLAWGLTLDLPQGIARLATGSVIFAAAGIPVFWINPEIRYELQQIYRSLMTSD